MVQGVDVFGVTLDSLLRRAAEVKEVSTVEPPLTKADLADITVQLDSTLFASADSIEQRKRIHAVIETVIRDTFNNLLVSLILHRE